MKTIRKLTAAALVLLAAALVCGCTVSSGVFTGMAQSSTDTSLCASYISFDGSLARRVQLKSGDEVTFCLKGGEGLEASVIKDTKQICGITDGGIFTALDDGRYDFTMKGKAKNGSFALEWRVE